MPLRSRGGGCSACPFIRNIPFQFRIAQKIHPVLCTGIGTFILIILGIKNKDSLKAVWDSLKKIPENPTPQAVEEVTKVISDIPIEPVSIMTSAVPSNSETLPFEVSRHIRNLPDGWHASQEKIEEALKNNISLVEGQTWVESYTKGGAAA